MSRCMRLHVCRWLRCVPCDSKSTLLYVCLSVPYPPEVSMKQSHLPVQRDLFNSVPAPPALAGLQSHHDELLELLSQLLWDVAHSTTEMIKNQENAHEQDQR